jgi:hypothetical protein
MMRSIDTSLLVEGERRHFDLGKWVAAARHEVLICDATVAEYVIFSFPHMIPHIIRPR